MAEMTFREACNQALREEMERDDSVFLMGEEVALYEGAYKVSRGLLEPFGARRVVDEVVAILRDQRDIARQDGRGPDEA